MSRQSEYKKKLDPETGKFTRGHIYGEGYKMDILKSVGKKLFGQTVKTAAKKALDTAATKTGEHVGKKAGDKIVSILSKEKTPKKQISKKAGDKIVSILSKEKTPKKSSRQKINAKVNSILSGGKII